ncbi:MAG: hypothetical protein Q8P31_06385 [Bacillota bacterium]|nr:hypothetical protein [Bacillota bacterium]
MSNMADKRERIPDAELDDRLTRALAAPEADPTFRAHLRRKVMEQHPAAGLEQPEKWRASDMTRVERHSAQKPRRSISLGRVAAAVAAVAVLAVVAAKLIMPAPGPVAEFGTLPGLAAGLPPEGGGAGGPGYEFEFTYGLGGALTSGWPKLQDKELAYKLRAEFTEARVAALATKLGITAPVVREEWHDGYLLAADPGDNGPSLRMFPGGYTAYSQPYDAEELPRSALPSDARAIEIARNWLVNNGFVPAGTLGAATVIEDLQNGSLYVRFKPAEPADIVTISPFGNVQITKGEKIAYGSATWFPAVGTSKYPLRPVADAWEQVRAGLGILDWHAIEFPGPSADDNLITGQATVDKVRVAWYLTFASDGTPYLVPVYAFSGTVQVGGGGDDGPTTLPFQVWAPAAASQHVQQ